MGTLGEKQDKPIYAKASPRRWVSAGNHATTETREPDLLETIDALAILPPHEPQHRHAALISPRPLATFTPPTQ